MLNDHSKTFHKQKERIDLIIGEKQNITNPKDVKAFIEKKAADEPNFFNK